MTHLPLPYTSLSGKLWYLQHNCVGDTIVYHWASSITLLTQNLTLEMYQIRLQDFIQTLFPNVNSLAPGRFEWNFKLMISKLILVIDG